MQAFSSPSAELAAFRAFEQSRQDAEEAFDEGRETAKWSCDAVRKKIMTFLATKEMTQTAFIQAIGSSAPSHSRFMKLKGAWNGTQNQTFWGAQRFFVAREAASKAAKAAMPTVEKKRKRESEVSDKAAKKSALCACGERTIVPLQCPIPSHLRDRRIARDTLLAKVRDPALTAKVEAEGVYDTCDEVRKKALAFMAARCETGSAPAPLARARRCADHSEGSGSYAVSGMSQTAFTKEIGSHPPSWSSFIKMKSQFAGHNPGAGNGAYPGTREQRPRSVSVAPGAAAERLARPSGCGLTSAGACYFLRVHH